MDEIPEKYRQDLAIINETVRQISRDLNVDGFEIVLSGQTHDAYHEIKMQLAPVVEILFKDKISFQSLLYRVDINEKDYRKALLDENSIPEKLSELIIRREFQKVITRRYFSSLDV